MTGVHRRRNPASVHRRKPRQKMPSSAATLHIERSPSDSLSSPSRSRAIASSRVQTSGETPPAGVSLDEDTAARQLEDGSLERQIVEAVPAVASAVLARLDVAADRESGDLLPARW